MKRIYLVRHAHTANNSLGDAGRFTGDLPLDDIGLQQAQQLATYISGMSHVPQIIVSSPLLRAKQTATVLADALHITISINENLTEFKVGDWGPRTIKDIVIDYSKVPRDNLPSFRPPNGESWFDLVERMQHVLGSLEAKQYHDVLIVSHGSPLQLYMAALLQHNPVTWLDGSMPANGSLTVLEKTADNWAITDTYPEL